MVRGFAVFWVLMLFFQPDLCARQADSSTIRKFFDRADSYMDTDHYDSAQFYLNKIYQQVSYREPSLFSYFLTSRQAEIYYYNNLPELGMQEAQRAINIASILKDDILKGDAYNFAGLFYFLTGKNSAAISSYKKSIALELSTLYPGKYLELSEPYHFYGNLAEVYEKLNQTDSAVHYNRLSLHHARQSHSARGLSTAYLNLANAFLKGQRIDSAHKYYTLCRKAALISKDFDVELNAYGGLANCAGAFGMQQKAVAQLDSGFALIKEFPQVNSYYSLLFLESAISILQLAGNFEKLSQAFKLKTQIQSATHQKNDIQIRSILMGGLKNETRILNLEVDRARQEEDLATTRLYFIVALVLLLLLTFAAYIFYSRQRLRLSNLRNKISQDLHDEVGATLSGIALYAHLAQKQSKQNQSSKAVESLQIINSNAKEMVKKLSDIVWAVNPANDNFEQLMQRLEEYAIEAGLPKGIEVRSKHDDELARVRLSMETRKNIYLIGLEAVNNAIKHSGCQVIKINAGMSGNHLRLLIADDGKGLDNEAVKRGNGLVNMQSRAREIGGNLSVLNQYPAGVQVELICKIT
jgi:signal transduction histidine kinase